MFVFDRQHGIERLRWKKKQNKCNRVGKIERERNQYKWEWLKSIHQNNIIENNWSINLFECEKKILCGCVLFIIAMIGCCFFVFIFFSILQFLRYYLFVFWHTNLVRPENWVPFQFTTKPPPISKVPTPLALVQRS